MSSVLFVCLGNICRSPTAHGVFQALVERQGLRDQIRVDSAGTGAWHAGESPDSRATQAAARRGYDLSQQVARQVVAADFDQFDYILAMDQANLAHLRQMKPEAYSGYLGLFLDFADCSESEVPDPYYGGGQGFEQVLDLVESASEGLLDAIRRGGR
ncbi:low molecular weight protein-tyrosine-phosphatase [Marinobacterium jannaschii]|uniref:low molecular weight protein-tyrosine-phosphatase n=1 Tax=Marinobacterium jannaschii TaxID=64970 RepID=UPI000484A670|nr:low molecular weight protein-tyrosine-phosphatase [Marinobacterium jannaschii]